MWVIVYVLELDTRCIRSQQISAMVSRYGLLLSKSFWKSFAVEQMVTITQALKELRMLFISLVVKVMV